MTDALTEKPNHLGVAAMALAAIALMVAVIHMTAGPFNPPEPVEQTIAETAVKIKEAAKRAMTGEPAPAPVPEARGFDVDRAVKIASLALAGLAMLLGVGAIAKREERAPALIGFSLGGGVLLVAWLQWIALLICGVIIIAAILHNIGDILSF